MKDKHLGFKAIAEKISKQQGVSKKEASAILASATRKYKKTSAGKKNPRLKRVKG